MLLGIIPVGGASQGQLMPIALEYLSVAVEGVSKRDIETTRSTLNIITQNILKIQVK